MRISDWSSDVCSSDLLIKTLPQELFANPQGQRAQGYQLSSDAVRAAMSGGDALYSEVQVHLNNLATLSRQVDMTTNAKDAAEIGRASCGERVCQYVCNWVVAV